MALTALWMKAEAQTQSEDRPDRVQEGAWGRKGCFKKQSQDPRLGPRGAADLWGASRFARGKLRDLGWRKYHSLSWLWGVVSVVCK